MRVAPHRPLQGKDLEAPAKAPCRICHSAEELSDDPLVAPCRCSGSLRYVHNSCQRAWLRAQRGPSDYTCELCRSRLRWGLTMATRFELVAVSLTSVVVWAAHAVSAWTMLKLGWRLLAICSRNAHYAVLARFVDMLPETATLTAACEALAAGRVKQLVLLPSAIFFVACSALALLRRPLTLVGEEMIARMCIVKIGGCGPVLLLVLRGMPAGAVFNLVGLTLLLDTLLLAFVRVPREERCERDFVIRVAQGAGRIASDFFPSVLVFVLWTVAIIMIAAAALVPCAILLFHEAVRDLRRRRQRHGSVQMAVIILRAMARLAALTSRHPPWIVPVANRCDDAVVCGWLCIEAWILLEVCIWRRGVDCSRTVASQVMWTLAVLGEVFLTTHAHFQNLGPGMCTSIPSVGSYVIPGDTSRAQVAYEHFAMLLCIACYLAIHLPVFAGWARRAHQACARISTHVNVDQVVFYNHPVHSGT